eukprot:COSAG01_NODE_17051_length_1182_cov_1.663897_1_plen_215_part_00
MLLTLFRPRRSPYHFVATYTGAPSPRAQPPVELSWPRLGSRAQQFCWLAPILFASMMCRVRRRAFLSYALHYVRGRPGANCACLEIFSNVELAIRPFGAMRCQSMPAAQQLALFCVDVDALNFSRILLIRCDAAVCLKLGRRSTRRHHMIGFLAVFDVGCLSGCSGSGSRRSADGLAEPSPAAWSLLGRLPLWLLFSIQVPQHWQVVKLSPLVP